MKRFHLPCVAGLLLVACASCAPSSPAGRIDRNRDVFDALPAKQQEDVRDGRISRGMSMGAVLIAWGRPAQEVEVMRADGAVVRWDYVTSQAVSAANFYGGYGYGRYGRYGSYRGAAIGFGPEFVFVPSHRASVWFVDGKVDAWESVR